jgi:hypothetical protein
VASTRFASVKIEPKDVIKLFSNRADVSCSIELEHLERLGKKHKHKTLEFPLPKNYSIHQDKDKKILMKHMQNYVPKNYIASTYFNSQDSFFERDGIKMARTTIRTYKTIKSKPK